MSGGLVPRLVAEIVIPGPPHPCARPKQSRFGLRYKDSRDRKAQGAISLLATPHFGRPLAGPVRVDVRFYLPIPPSWSAKQNEAARQGFLRPVAAKRNDVDNLAKTVLDGLAGVAFVDDGQVVEQAIAKLYSAEPRTEILVFVLETALVRDPRARQSSARRSDDDDEDTGKRGRVHAARARRTAV